MTQQIRQFYDSDVGLLPLANRFIVIDYKGTRWAIPARIGIDLAVAYYEEQGWYEPCELAEDTSLTQPAGEELRDCVECNTELDVHIKEQHWWNLRKHAERIYGKAEGPDDKVWWFEENGGSVTEMTDLPPDKQEPEHLFWFGDEYLARHPELKVEIKESNAQTP